MQNIPDKRSAVAASAWAPHSGARVLREVTAHTLEKNLKRCRRKERFQHSKQARAYGFARRRLRLFSNADCTHVFPRLPTSIRRKSRIAEDVRDRVVRNPNARRDVDWLNPCSALTFTVNREMIRRLGGNGMAESRGSA
jgi:hypothetical protein